MLMIGEYDFNGSFTWENIQKSQVISKAGWLQKVFPIFVQGVLVSAMFAVSIIISNLITGLTVNNISELRKEAGYFKLGKTVKQIKSSEEFLNGRLLRFAKKCFPRYLENSLWAKLQQNSVTKDDILVCVEPNANHTHDENITKMFESNDYEVYMYDTQHKKKIPKKLGMQIPDWIVRKTFKYVKENEIIQTKLNDSLQEIIKDDQMQGLFRGTSVESYQQNEVPTANDTSDDFLDVELNAIDETIKKMSNISLMQYQKTKIMEIESKLMSLRS